MGVTGILDTKNKTISASVVKVRTFDRNLVDFKGDVGAVNATDKTFAYTVSSEKFTVKVNNGTKITDAGLTKAFSDLKEGQSLEVEGVKDASDKKIIIAQSIKILVK